MIVVNEEREAQLSLPLPTSGDVKKSRYTRVWIAAAEPDDEERLIRVTSAVERRFRTEFVDAGTGFPVFASNDIILLRTSRNGRFNLLAAWPRVGCHGVHSPENLCQEVERWLRSDRISVRRGQLVDDIVALTFTPGPKPSASHDAGLRQGAIRTGLERLLLALQEQAPTRARTLSICHQAERSIDERVHPALRGIFRRRFGDAMVDHLLRDQLGAESEMKQIASIYDDAAADFRRCGLNSQLRATLSRRAIALEHWEQPNLPGLPSPCITSGFSSLGHRMHRMFALPLEIQLSTSMPPEGADREANHFRCFGQVTVDDKSLWRLIRESTSRRHRLMAHIQSHHSFITLSAGLRNELHALLGTLATEGSGRRDIMLIPRSDSLTFSPDEACLASGELAQFDVLASRDGIHSIFIQALTSRGGEAILHFKFRSPMVEASIHAQYIQ